MHFLGHEILAWHKTFHPVNCGNVFFTDLKQSGDLPSISDFEDNLENEVSGLGADKPPPLLYDNLQQQEMHKYVEELRQSVADEEIAAYLNEFERKVEEEIIEVGDISLEDVQVSSYHYPVCFDFKSFSL